MSTSGVPSDNDDNDVEGLTQWPLFYASDTKEYMCGWCGQALGPNHTTDDLEVHFKSCGNSKERQILMNLNELQKMDQTSEAQMDEINTKVGEESEIEKTDFVKKISDLKSDLKNDLETEIKAREASDKVLAISWHKIINLEKNMREMGVAQEAKMAEVSGRVDGVIESISTVVHSLLEAKGSSSADSDAPDPSKKEFEAIWAQLREIQSVKTQLGNKLPEAEAFLEQVNRNERGLPDAKRPSEGETSKPKTSKKIKKSVHQELSLSDQFVIPMNCFNLISHAHLFQPSFRWTIQGIAAYAAQNTFELTSDMFQWNGYPVQSRVQLQLKEDGCVYISLCLKNETEAKSFSPVPQVFYFLKDKNEKHVCHSQAYMRGSVFNSFLQWGLRFVHKSWLQHSTCNVDDSVEIEVYVEPFPIAQYVHSYDGTLEWNIENYARRRWLEKRQSLYFQESPYFYTGPNGLRVQVRLCLNGAEGRGPTARVMFFTGVFDEALSNYFPHSTTVIFVNRKDPERSVSKTVLKDVRNAIEYTFKICKMEEMKNLIEDDALFCRVVIKAQ